MAKYTDESNITFNNAVAGDPMPKITNGMNDYTDLDAGVNPLVNAIEIDWNEAQLGTYIVKTTGELLSYISNISEKISNLENPIERSKA